MGPIRRLLSHTSQRHEKLQPLHHVSLLCTPPCSAMKWHPYLINCESWNFAQETPFLCTWQWLNCTAMRFHSPCEVKKTKMGSGCISVHQREMKAIFPVTSWASAKQQWKGPFCALRPLGQVARWDTAALVCTSDQISVRPDVKKNNKSERAGGSDMRCVSGNIVEIPGIRVTCLWHSLTPEWPPSAGVKVAQQIQGWQVLTLCQLQSFAFRTEWEKKPNHLCMCMWVRFTRLPALDYSMTMSWKSHHSRGSSWFHFQMKSQISPTGQDARSTKLCNRKFMWSEREVKVVLLDWQQSYCMLFD